jgi:energy-coupling factor transporter ATP-binding protein EcfA2
MTASAEVRDVRYAYPGAPRPAIAGVSLAVEPGEVVAVAGESGSGKSTLARLLAGLLRPGAGSVRLGGLELRGRSPRDIAGRVGIVFQHPNHQLLTSTVHEELALGPRNLGLGDREVEARVTAATRRFGLGGVLDEHPYALALPVRRRLAIASIVVMRPPVLVLDEPTGALDAAETADLEAVIRAASRGGDALDEDPSARRPERASGPAAIIVVTHDLRFAGSIADRLLVLRDGTVVADGPAQLLLGDVEGLAAVGLEAPPLVRLAAALRLDPALALATPGDAMVDAIRAREGLR